MENKIKMTEIEASRGSFLCLGQWNSFTNLVNWLIVNNVKLSTLLMTIVYTVWFVAPVPKYWMQMRPFQASGQTFIFQG